MTGTESPKMYRRDDLSKYFAEPAMKLCVEMAFFSLP